MNRFSTKLGRAASGFALSACLMLATSGGAFAQGNAVSAARAPGAPLTPRKINPSKGDPLKQFEDWRRANRTTMPVPPDVRAAHIQWAQSHGYGPGGINGKGKGPHTKITSTALQNGVTVTGLAGATGSNTYFTLDVPAGATGLSFVMSGGTGDADLYVKFGTAPTLSSYDCRPYITGNGETCNISNVQAGTYYVMINGYQAYSGVSLTGSYSTGGGGGGSTLSNGVPVSNLSGSSGQQLNFTMDVPSGATGLSFAMSGGSGDADLYVKFGSAPTLSSYDCRPYITGNNETCNISNVQAGTYYVMINGYSSFSGVTLTGSYTAPSGGGNQAPTASFTKSCTDLACTFDGSASSDPDGSIASYAWDFGDGNTGTGATPSHSYSAGGTYTVQLTVTDNGGLTNSTSQSVTVTAPTGGGGNTLTNGVAVTGLSGSTGQQLNYTMDVPAGATNLSFAMSGGTGDADLYVKFGSAPTLSSYDCRPYITGNNETCNISNVQTGTYYVMINGYSSFSGVSLTGSYTASSGGGGTGGGGATIGANVDLSTVSGYQGEVTIAADPNNAQHLVAGANTFYQDPASNCQATSGTTYGTQALYFSTNGGSSWTYNCAPWPSNLTGGSGTQRFGSDPSSAFDSNGNAYVSYMLIATDGTTDTGAIVVAKTTDNGASWQPWGIVVNNFANSNVFDDKNMMAIDTTSGGTYSHTNRVYVIWDENNVERVAYSDDGSTWTTKVVESNGVSSDIGGDLAIGSDGTIYAVWNRTASTSESTVFSKSTDGGNTWTSPSTLTSHTLYSFGSNNKPPAQDTRGVNSFASIAVDTDASSANFGNLYVVYDDFPSGTSSGTNLNVYMRRSTNGGSTWSSAVKVNDDTGSATQFFPWVAVDEGTGNVVVSWYDTRNDSNNTRTQTFFSYSTDGGQTFSANQQVAAASSAFSNSSIDYSDENTSDNSSGNGNQYGDYAQIAISGGIAHPIWTDTRQFFPSNSSNAAKEDVGTAAVTLP